MSFLEDVRLVSDELEQYYRESASGDPPVVHQLPVREIVKELDLKSLLEKGTLSGKVLAEFVQRLLEDPDRNEIILWEYL